ncbi:MAG TPA: hypothetical protein VKR31_12695 [Rhizomicrobium sp.]|nr:hypothetical protein [Rhizomicrobium sp.]
MSEESAKSPLPDQAERRRSGRSRTLLGATIIFRDGTTTVPCMVRNRTEHGTQLEIPPNPLIPKRFYLVTAKDNEVYEAELVWKKANRIGVTIGKRVDPSTTNARALQVLRKLKPVHGANAEADPNRKLWDDDRWPV